ncbi:hypothetical protein C0992_006301, partial [Termitomyces sp. T32_za158]
MSAFRSDAGLAERLGTPPNAPSTSTSGSSVGGTLNADAAAPQVAARPPPVPKVEKARPKMRASKAALTITPRAVGRLQGLLKGPAPRLIRIGVRNKGCAGLSYHLEYVEEPGKFDEVVEQDGVRVVIDSKALFSIIGSEMDWSEDALSLEKPCMDFLAAVPDVRPFSHAAPVPRLPCALQSPSPALPFVPVVPAHLPALLADPRTLVLDIRPHAAHADARLPRALSLSDHDDDDTDDASSTGTPILCTRRLPMSAFGPASTVASTPFFDAVRQNRELSHGIIERIPLRLPSRVRRRIADLPLPWLREIAQRADRTHVRTSSRIRHDLDPSSSDSSGSEAVPSTAAVDQGTEILAMQFHRIELAEQKRLMGVMDHHSKESRQPPLTDCLPGRSFPFSITAGVEKGSKNRYQHIWPFEHARVKLCQTGREGIDVGLDDYVNASFVQPLGTTKKYIATQGPLEATFEDFWRLTWQQNVHVIVMLTREVENSMVKCGTYWADAPAPAMRERTFGMLRVTLVAKSGLPGDVDLLHEDGDGDARAKKRRHVTTIKRTFRLEHRGYPNAGSRQVVHLQYLEWPDMTVPEDTRGVLGLVEEVDKAVRETETEEGSPAVEKCQGAGAGAWGDVDPLNGVAWHVVGGRRPVLLHCSAGVGRTG